MGPSPIHGAPREFGEDAVTESAELTDGWELLGTDPGLCSGPQALPTSSWIPAHVPGTVAGAMLEAGLDPGEDPGLDARDWWFRTRFRVVAPDSNERLHLRIGGLATIAEVFVDDVEVVRSESMFAAASVDLAEFASGEHALTICCRALDPLLAVRRRPRARWRTKVVRDGGLRFFRTTLIGRAPGFAPGPSVVGPWRPVTVERERSVAVHDRRVRARLVDGDGYVQARVIVESLAPAADVQAVILELEGPTGTHRAALDLSPRGGLTVATGSLVVADVAPWWPHTHGHPTLYEARLRVRCGDGQRVVAAGHVGFVDLVADLDADSGGLVLTVNGKPLFARGAVWMPLDMTVPDASEHNLRGALELAVGAGMNLLRLPGTAWYESRRFHDLCDELGILIWQDFMFANLDYPEGDPAFMETVEQEARQVLSELGERPSLAVVCGGSEVAQQVAMLGLDPALATGELYGELLPGLVAEADVQAVYIPSTPWGGSVPFAPDRGVAHYYGVGAYRRPLDDARRSAVRFASECLAFSNVPDLADDWAGRLTTPDWKRGVPRDTGAGWDFEDVRDHYLRLLFGLDAAELRSFDPDRYLALSRQVTGEVMAEVLGEWRRDGSPCAGAIVLWLHDLVPGAGWGLIDADGRPKLALRHVARALAPLAVWSTDEGLSGYVAHVANDRGTRHEARLRVALYRDFEVRVAEASRDLTLEPHSTVSINVEELLGRFVDVGYAYRFGSPAQDAVVISLERVGETGIELISQCVRFPVGAPTTPEPAERLGITVSSHEAGPDALVTIASDRLAYGVRVNGPEGELADDDGFCVEPGHDRTVRLSGGGGARITVSALNLHGRVVTGGRKA
jgi:beta-mannosidase